VETIGKRQNAFQLDATAQKELQIRVISEFEAGYQGSDAFLDH